MFCGFATFVMYSFSYPIHSQTKIASLFVLWKFKRYFIFLDGNQIIIIVFPHTNFHVFSCIFMYFPHTNFHVFFHEKQVSAKASTNKGCC